MKKTYLLISLLLVTIAGFMGGFVSDRITHYTAFADSNKNEILAKSIHLIDTQGNRRAGLVFENGYPVLYFNDSKGVVRAYLAAGDWGPQLVFRGKDGESRLYIRAREDGGSAIGLLRGQNKPRLVLSYSPSQGPIQVFFNENNEGKAMASVIKGKPSFSLLKNNKKPAMAMVNYPGEGSVLSIWGDKGQPKVSLGLMNRAPGLFIYEKHRTGLYFRSLPGQSPFLGLLENGSPIWSATGAAPPPAPDMTGLDDIMRDVLR